MDPRPKGRKPKLTPEVMSEVTMAVAGGAYFKDACAHAGIVPQTGYVWLAKGEEPPPERDQYESDLLFAQATERWSLYADFKEATSKAEADAKIAALARIQRAGRSGIWTADAWYLERKYPHEFGRRIHEVSGPEGGPIPIADESRARIHELLERLAPSDEAIAGNGGSHSD